MLLRNFKGVLLTVETLPGKVVMQQSRCHPHDAQDEQSEEQEQHHSLIHPRHDTLRKQDPRVHAQMTTTFQPLFEGFHGYASCRYLLRACKPLWLREEVGKGHEEDQGQVGEKEN